MPIKVYMIIPDKSESAILQERWRQAEESLNNAGDGFAIDRMSQNDVLALGKTTSYSHEHIFVAPKFGGKAFDHLITLGCRVFGTPCILQCINRRTSLPRRLQPIFAQLMNDVLVCCSGLDREKKEHVFKVVRWLGGDYKLDLTSEVTHLIANKVGSPKYAAFIRLNKPIVTTGWIDELWRFAETCYPFPEDLLFKSISKFILAPFAGLVICTSGFRDEERRYFKQQVEKHGGIFTGQLRQNECTHLIVRELHGDKYEAAVVWGNVKVVAPSWLFESVHAGCCLPEENYVLHGPRPPKLNEIVTTSQDTDSSVGEKNKKSQKEPFALTSFMSNCSIYLHNLSGVLNEELKKMIVAAGGMHVVEPLELVTHVVCSSEQDLNEAQEIVSTHCSLAQIVSPDWIRQSFVSLKMLDETPFDLLRQKSEKLRNSTTILAEATILVQEDYAEVSVIGGNATSLSTSSSRLSSSIIQPSSYRRIALDGFKAKSERLNEVLTTLKRLDCEISTLNPSTCPDSVDLLIVPFGQPLSSSAECLISSGIACVNSLFLEIVKTALDRHNKIHRNNSAALQPMSLTKLLPDLDEQLANPLVRTLNATTPCLESCCITLTGFDQPERSLLVRLVIALGAAHQELFARTATNSKSMQLQKSTHLIAAKPSGEKFEKAKHWDVPALKRDWLLECWRMGCRVPEEDFSLLASNSKFNKTLNETACPLGEKSILNVTKPVEEEKIEEVVVSEQQLPPPPPMPLPATPGNDEKTSISRRLDAILAASKSGDNSINSLRLRRQSPMKTPKTPSLHHETANFIAPHRPNPIHYGVESSQSLQVMWGDDCASNRFSLGIERIEEEAPSAARLKSLTLVEDALSSPNASCDNSGHPKCSPLNGSSNSEPVVVLAPDAVVIRSNVVFPNDLKSPKSAPVETNITRNSLSPPVFQFTGLSAPERDDAAALLERLGAKVVAVPPSSMAEGTIGASLTDSPLEASCTHLIVAEPSRTQKFLSGIASGKWILHRSYIDACRVENRLVDEAPFEWGSDRCADPPSSACKGDFQLAKRLAQSGHRWRVRLSGSSQKAFSDWKAILLIANLQVELSFKQILIAGGATIVPLPQDFSPPPASSFTHWLVEPGIPQFLQNQSSANNSPARPARIQWLRRSYDTLMRFLSLCGGPGSPNGGGCVVRHDYLQSYLLNDPIPSLRQNLLNVNSFQLQNSGPSSTSTSSSGSTASPARKIPSSVLAQNNYSGDPSGPAGDNYAHPDKRLRTVYTTSSASRPQK